MKCLVKGCQNTSDGGKFLGSVCAPCHEMITSGKVHHRNPTFIGDLSREAVPKADLVLIERALRSAITAEEEFEASGDAGHWDVEDQDHIILARKALARVYERLSNRK